MAIRVDMRNAIQRKVSGTDFAGHGICQFYLPGDLTELTRQLLRLARRLLWAFQPLAGVRRGGLGARVAGEWGAEGAHCNISSNCPSYSSR